MVGAGPVTAHHRDPVTWEAPDAARAILDQNASAVRGIDQRS
jgi:hypothetical protein